MAQRPAADPASGRTDRSLTLPRCNRTTPAPKRRLGGAQRTRTPRLTNGAPAALSTTRARRYRAHDGARTLAENAPRASVCIDLTARYAPDAVRPSIATRCDAPGRATPQTRDVVAANGSSNACIAGLTRPSA